MVVQECGVIIQGSHRSEATLRELQEIHLV